MIKSFEVTELPGEFASRVMLSMSLARKLRHDRLFISAQFGPPSLSQESNGLCAGRTICLSACTTTIRWTKSRPSKHTQTTSGAKGLEHTQLWLASTSCTSASYPNIRKQVFQGILCMHISASDVGIDAAGVLLSTPACPTSCPHQMTCSSSCGTGKRAGPATRSLRATHTMSCRSASFHAPLSWPVPGRCGFAIDPLQVTAMFRIESSDRWVMCCDGAGDLQSEGHQHICERFAGSNREGVEHWAANAQLHPGWPREGSQLRGLLHWRCAPYPSHPFNSLSCGAILPLCRCSSGPSPISRFTANRSIFWPTY